MTQRTMTHDVMYIIESLAPGDPETGKKLADELKNTPGLSIRPEEIIYVKLNAKEDIYDYLLKIESESREKHPIIHFEMHGCEECLSTTDYYLNLKDKNRLISWRDLGYFLRRINIQTKNNLFVTLAVCIGAAFIRSFSPTRAAPANCFVGSYSEILVPNLVISYDAFYKSFLADGDLDKANTLINQVSKDWFEQNHDELIALKIPQEYIDNFRYDFISSEKHFKLLADISLKEDADKTFERIKEKFNEVETDEEKRRIFDEAYKPARVSCIKKMGSKFFMTDSIPENEKIIEDIVKDYM
ncbi:hypothetical protein [Fibrobacter sp.]|uniref:hypothetical protein n=1 Tax=Fibrobacter sp. TaxID=35828 RepID=UPI0025C65AB9|nr:hypothetical protein [Fibrobacter sp.]MBR3070333.1 hypothetical protein [Fibrobacter sp.]